MSSSEKNHNLCCYFYFNIDETRCDTNVTQPWLEHMHKNSCGALNNFIRGSGFRIVLKVKSKSKIFKVATHWAKENGVNK